MSNKKTAKRLQSLSVPDSRQLTKQIKLLSEENEELREANKHLQHLLDSDREYAEHLEKTTENLTNELLKGTRKNTEDPKTFSNGENQVLLSLINEYFDYNRDSLKGVYQFLDAGLGLVRDLVQISAEQEKQQFNKNFELELNKQKLEEKRFEHEVELSTQKASEAMSARLRDVAATCVAKPSFEGITTLWQEKTSEKDPFDSEESRPYQLAPEDLYRRIAKHLRGESDSSEAGSGGEKKSSLAANYKRLATTKYSSPPPANHFENKEIKIEKPFENKGGDDPFSKLKGPGRPKNPKKD